MHALITSKVDVASPVLSGYSVNRAGGGRFSFSDDDRVVCSSPLPSDLTLPGVGGEPDALRDGALDDLDTFEALDDVLESFGAATWSNTISSFTAGVAGLAAGVLAVAVPSFSSRLIPFSMTDGDRLDSRLSDDFLLLASFIATGCGCSRWMWANAIRALC